MLVLVVTCHSVVATSEDGQTKEIFSVTPTRHDRTNLVVLLVTSLDI